MVWLYTFFVRWSVVSCYLSSIFPPSHSLLTRINLLGVSVCVYSVSCRLCHLNVILSIPWSAFLWLILGTWLICLTSISWFTFVWKTKQKKKNYNKKSKKKINKIKFDCVNLSWWLLGACVPLDSITLARHFISKVKYTDLLQYLNTSRLMIWHNEICLSCHTLSWSVWSQ